MKVAQLVLVVPFVSFAAACADGEPPVEVAPAATDGALVYGTDGRKEYYQLTDTQHVRLADATVVLVDPQTLTPVSGGYVVDTSATFGVDYDLCADEPFQSQPDPGWCSGFAVGPDLIVTAGHCVSASSCSSVRFVFGFRMDNASTVRAQVATDDVYRCSTVVARAQTSTNDWAVVRVERTIVGHPFLPIRRTGTVGNGAALVVAGHPAGLPLKLSADATVRSDNQANYFEANLDVYGGNSGSPVLGTASGLVEGVLVRGNPDFDYYAGEGCYRSNVCPDTGCPGWEDASRTTKFSLYVPELQSCTIHSDCADADLCDGAEVCSNGVCGPGTPVVCGGGQVCQAGACVTPACGAVNTSCTSNGQCCSNSCNKKKNRCR